jgi:hypothetical protein
LGAFRRTARFRGPGVGLLPLFPTTAPPGNFFLSLAGHGCIPSFSKSFQIRDT